MIGKCCFFLKQDLCKLKPAPDTWKGFQLEAKFSLSGLDIFCLELINGFQFTFFQYWVNKKRKSRGRIQTIVGKFASLINRFANFYTFVKRRVSAETIAMSELIISNVLHFAFLNYNCPLLFLTCISKRGGKIPSN